MKSLIYIKETNDSFIIFGMDNFELMYSKDLYKFVYSGCHEHYFTIYRKDDGETMFKISLQNAIFFNVSDPETVNKF